MRSVTNKIWKDLNFFITKYNFNNNLGYPYHIGEGYFVLLKTCKFNNITSVNLFYSIMNSSNMILHVLVSKELLTFTTFFNTLTLPL